MGRQFRALCRTCGEGFEASDGPGMTFYLARCERCGREKNVSRERLLREAVKRDPGGPVPMELEYLVPDVVHDCKCGGKFSTGAPPRCPKCQSTDIEAGDTIRQYE